MKYVGGYYDSWGCELDGAYDYFHHWIPKRSACRGTQFYREFHAINTDDDPTIEIVKFVVNYTPPVMLSVVVYLADEISIDEIYELNSITQEFWHPVHAKDYSPYYTSSFHRGHEHKFVVDIVRWDHFGAAYGMDKGVPFLRKFFDKYAPALTVKLDEMLAFVLPESPELKPTKPEYALRRDKFEAVRQERGFDLNRPDWQEEKSINEYIQEFNLDINDSSHDIDNFFTTRTIDFSLPEMHDYCRASKQAMLDTLPFRENCVAYANEPRKNTPPTAFRPFGKAKTLKQFKELIAKTPKNRLSNFPESNCQWDQWEESMGHETFRELCRGRKVYIATLLKNKTESQYRVECDDPNQLFMLQTIDFFYAVKFITEGGVYSSSKPAICKMVPYCKVDSTQLLHEILKYTVTTPFQNTIVPQYSHLPWHAGHRNVLGRALGVNPAVVRILLQLNAKPVPGMLKNISFDRYHINRTNTTNGQAVREDRQECFELLAYATGKTFDEAPSTLFNLQKLYDQIAAAQLKPRIIAGNIANYLIAQLNWLGPLVISEPMTKYAHVFFEHVKSFSRTLNPTMDENPTHKPSRPTDYTNGFKTQAKMLLSYAKRTNFVAGKTTVNFCVEGYHNMHYYPIAIADGGVYVAPFNTAKEPEPSETSYSAIAIGTCLFGTHITGISESGTHPLTDPKYDYPDDCIITDIKVNNDWHLYEDITFHMLKHAINMSKQNPKMVLESILPAENYILIAAGLVLQGKMSKDAFTKYCAIIRDRREKYLAEMHKIMRENNFQGELNTDSPLSTLSLLTEDLFEDKKFTGTEAERFDYLLGRLCSEGDKTTQHVWKEIREKVKQKKIDKTLIKLAKTAYCVKFGVSASKHGANNVLMFVENKELPGLTFYKALLAEKFGHLNALLWLSPISINIARFQFNPYFVGEHLPDILRLVRNFNLLDRLSQLINRIAHSDLLGWLQLKYSIFHCLDAHEEHIIHGNLPRASK